MPKVTEPPTQTHPHKRSRGAARAMAAIALLVLFALSVHGLLSTGIPASTPVPPATPRMMQSVGPLGIPGVVSDLPDIRFRREFRVLVAPRNVRSLPGDSVEKRQAEQIRLLEKFADEQFLIPVFIPIEDETRLSDALFQGQGDLIGTALAHDVFARHGLRPSIPVANRREILVAREGDRGLTRAELKGREIALSARSGFWPQLQALKRDVTGISVRIIDEAHSSEEVLEKVRRMELDLAVVDAQPGSIGVEPYADLVAVDGFNATTNLTFAMHPRSKEMRASLDEFLARERLAQRPDERYRASWSEIKRRGLLRVITRNNSTTYFIWRGKPVGFEYDLIAKFAREHDLSLQMVVPQRRDDLLRALNDGRGDVVAAPIAIANRRHPPSVRFTRAYMTHRDIFVTRRENRAVRSAEDLNARNVYARRSSIAWETLEALLEAGVGFNLVAVPEHLEDEDILERTARGDFDIAVASERSIKVASLWRDDIDGNLELGAPVEVGWAVRDGNNELLHQLNAFIEKEYREVEYNMLRTRYFDNSDQVRAHVTQRADGINGGELSPYDELVQRYAANHGFDWALIVAIMYRESRFNPDVTSFAGAQGLMQVLPVTAKRFGITDLKKPENSIAAGVRMLSWLYRRLEPSLPVRERIWFTLAAYNAGLGHLKDARRLAVRLGLDPNRWFDNVERAMLLLSKPKYYRKARHGYVRGREPVDYVRDIRDLYDAYRSLLRS